MCGDGVSSWDAGRLGHPSLAEADEDPREAAAARRVILMAGLAGSAGEVHHDRNDEFRTDRLEEPALLERLRIAERFGDHPRKTKRQNGVGQYPVRCAFEGDD